MIIRIGNFLFHYRNALFPVGYVAMFINGPAVFSDYHLAFFLGLAVAVFGQSLRAATIGLDYIIRGGRNRQVYADKLVQGGLFAHCRNPLYVGNFLILLGVGIASNSRFFLAIGIPGFLFAYWAIIAAEEAFLRGKFGDDFTAYCARVNRLLPNFGGLSQTLQGMRFNWRRLITAEYGTTYIWMAAILLLALKHLWFRAGYRAHQDTAAILWIALALVTVAYGVARFLKKSGKLAGA
jgi:protein-S-isoprenylcysteine O-methyltransferase Ste14